jgi:hypothetical protein
LATLVLASHEAREEAVQVPADAVVATVPVSVDADQYNGAAV